MTMVLDGIAVELDRDGFLANPDQWSPDVALAIAQQNGIDVLTDRHWQVIDFCRTDRAATGEPPGLRRITKETGIPMKEMYQLFPKGPGILASKIAGLTKPKSCV